MLRLCMLALLAAIVPIPTSQWIATPLYDASAAGQTPDQQGFVFATYSAGTPAATSTWENGATLLDTWAQIGDLAGYTARDGRVPALYRAVGYGARARLQIVQEAHTSENRAGFSIVLLGADRRGIELDFWENRIWAQDDGTTTGLFQQAEGVAFDTTAALRTYEIAVQGDRYVLSADGAAILGGPLRDYSAFDGPINPYRTPNTFILSDNSTSGRAQVRIASAALIAPAPIYLPIATS